MSQAYVYLTVFTIDLVRHAHAAVSHVKTVLNTATCAPTLSAYMEAE